MSKSISLPENLTIHQISEHFAEIKRAVAGANSAVQFDAAALDNIDTSGVQMLLAVVKSLNERGVSVSWENQGSGLVDSAKQLGLSQALQLS